MPFAFIAKLRRPVLGALVAVLAVPAAAAAAGDPPPTPDQLDRAGVHEIVVKRTPGLDAAGRAQVRAAADVTLANSMPLADTEIVRAAPGHLAAALAALQADPSVVYAEPNAPVHAFTTDALWGQQWALRNTGQTPYGSGPGLAGADIDTSGAWATGATGAGQVVAIVDSGVNAAHPDMAGQIATSPAGRDWVGGDGNPDDGNGHGSHVAGIVAAHQGRRGISGVAPDARLLPLRVLDNDGSGWSDDVAAAYAYAGDQHVGIVNASLGGPSISDVETDAFDAHPQTLYVVAAGNGGSDGVGDDNDVTPTYPCAATEPNVICVGATNNRDQRASFSNYGKTTVDLFAPGVSVISAWRAPEFGWWYDNGTSMAAPHVAGTLALMRGAAPALDAAELKQALLDSVDVLPQLHNLSVTDGRLDAAAAVQAARSLSTSRYPGADTDGDNVPDTADNCPSAPNALQSDADSDGIGTACDPTPNGPDEDADGVPDTTDDCMYAADPGQLDSDADGLGDACDPTPVPPRPAALVPPTATPTPPSGSPIAPPPVLGALTAPSQRPTVRVCRPGARGCRPVPMTVTYSLDRAAAVTAQVQRRECRGACRYVTAATVRVIAKAGANRLTIGARGKTARLRAGSYRLRVVAGAPNASSGVRVLAFRVR